MGPFIGGVFIALLGIYFIKNSIANFKDFEVSKAWPSTLGTITKSDVWRPKSTSSHYVWSVEYTYRVDDKQYRGNRAALYTPLYQEIEAWQKGRAENDETQVFYDPEKPEESVLIPGGRDEKKYGEIILSVTVTCFGIAIMVAGHLGYIG